MWGTHPTPHSRLKYCWHNALSRNLTISCWPVRSLLARATRVLALDYAERVLADTRTRPYDVLSAATLVLSATRRDSEPYASAWKQIEAVARDPKNPASLDALAVLAQAEALPPINPIGGNASVSLESPPAQSPTPSTEGEPQPPRACIRHRLRLRRWNPRRAQYLRRNPAIR